MSVQYMQHPNHGWITVSSAEEIEIQKKSGWIVADRILAEANKSGKKILDIQSSIDRETKTPEDAYEKKFGKKPHHRMSRDTIENALKE